MNTLTCLLLLFVRLWHLQEKFLIDLSAELLKFFLLLFFWFKSKFLKVYSIVLSNLVELVEKNQHQIPSDDVLNKFSFSENQLTHIFHNRLLQTMLSFTSHPSHLVSSIVLPFWEVLYTSKKFSSVCFWIYSSLKLF